MLTCVVAGRLPAGTSVEMQLRGLPMDRFYSHQSIELYRKLFDRSTDESQRRPILKFLAAQAHAIQMGTTGELRVRVEQHGDNYIWELRRDGHLRPVKFSAAIYLSEEAARASGNDVLTTFLARSAARL